MASVNMKNLGEALKQAHWGAKMLMAVAVLSVVAVVLYCTGVLKLPFYPTPDIYNRLTGAGTGLDFPVVRPEGFAPVASNSCAVHGSQDSPIAANACQHKGAPISANKVVRLINDTPSGFDCTCSGPAGPGDVLGVVKRMSPSDLNQPLGAVSALDEAQQAAGAAANAAHNAMSEVEEARANGRSNATAESNAAKAANAAQKASYAADMAAAASHDNKVLAAEKASKEAKDNAKEAMKYRAHTQRALSGGDPVSVLDALDESPKAANANANAMRSVMEMNGSDIKAYSKSGKGVRM